GSAAALAARRRNLRRASIMVPPNGSRTTELGDDSIGFSSAQEFAASGRMLRARKSRNVSGAGTLARKGRSGVSREDAKGGRDEHEAVVDRRSGRAADRRDRDGPGAEPRQHERPGRVRRVT